MTEGTSFRILIQTFSAFIPIRSSFGPITDVFLEYEKGLNLLDAPDMDEGLFIGREIGRAHV